MSELITLQSVFHEKSVSNNRYASPNMKMHHLHGRKFIRVFTSRIQQIYMKKSRRKKKQVVTVTYDLLPITTTCIVYFQQCHGPVKTTYLYGCKNGQIKKFINLLPQLTTDKKSFRLRLTTCISLSFLLEAVAHYMFFHLRYFSLIHNPFPDAENKQMALLFPLY